MNEKTCMMREVNASGTIFMGCSIFVMMESESHYRNKKANEQETKNLLIHKTTMHELFRSYYKASSSSAFLFTIK
jgi:hypothetical protein